MRHGLYLAAFGALADPRLVIDLAAAAEAQGWAGFFLWDHLLRPPGDPAELADAWTVLSGVAGATSAMRIGPLVTPIARRRPQVVARQAVTLDHLSAGRVTLGVGLGNDRGRELSAFGEILDPRQRGDALDEGIELITALWSGEEVHHRGAHFRADGVRFLPRPVQQPRIPLWLAARGDARRPVRRAARYDGLFPVDVDPDQLARMLDLVAASRGGLEGFDVAVAARAGTDVAAFERLGATWALWSFPPGAPVGEIRARIEAGPG